jgi:predicted patatin/cPLA2 family phospholipase
MKALCVSGGGSMGAWAGGIIENLSKEKDWDIYFGTSTGSLIIPLVASNNIEKLKTAYTSISENDVFLYNPFKVIKSRKGFFKFTINHVNIIKSFLKNNVMTLGDSTNLRKTLSNFLNPEEYEFIKKSGKSVNVTVSNLTTEKLEVKSSNNESYDDFLDWILASSSATPFMSLVQKNGFDYADGGILRFIPIEEAILAGATEIDAIILMEEKSEKSTEKVRNVLHLIGKMIKIFLYSRKIEDTNLKRLSLISDKEITLNLYYLPRNITNNPYIFDNEVMKSWWEESFKLSKEGPNQSYLLKPGIIRNNLKK